MTTGRDLILCDVPARAVPRSPRPFCRHIERGRDAGDVGTWRYPCVRVRAWEAVRRRPDRRTRDRSTASASRSSRPSRLRLHDCPAAPPGPCVRQDRRALRRAREDRGVLRAARLGPGAAGDLLATPAESESGSRDPTCSATGDGALPAVGVSLITSRSPSPVFRASPSPAAHIHANLTKAP